MKGVYMKNGEVTEIYLGNGITEIFPVPPEEMPPVLIAGEEELFGDEHVFQGLTENDGVIPQADIWASIIKELQKEENLRKYLRYRRIQKIKKTVVPVLALIAIFLLAITPDSYDMLPAGTKPTMLIIVALAAAAYLGLISLANYQKGKKNDSGRYKKKYGYLRTTAKDR